MHQISWGNLPCRNYPAIIKAANVMIACNLAGRHEMSVARGRIANMVLPPEIKVEEVNYELAQYMNNHAALVEIVDGGDESTVPVSAQTEQALNIMFEQLV